MKRAAYLALVLAALTAFFNDFAFAHVPYIEEQDFTDGNPFRVRKSVEQSIAVYSWLQFDDETFDSVDLDPYVFRLTDAADVFLQVLVPACAGYKAFAPWFALVGPDLPDPTEDYPFEIPSGEGVLVTPNNPTYPRETFYEPFGNQTYFDGPTFDETVSTPGDYKIYYWDPDQKGGDYVAVTP